MSIKTEIERINKNISDSYDSIQNWGASFKNIFDYYGSTWSKAYLTNNGGMWGSTDSLMPNNYIKVKSNTTYVLSYKLGPKCRNVDNIFLCLYDNGKKLITPPRIIWENFKIYYNSRHVLFQIFFFTHGNYRNNRSK